MKLRVVEKRWCSKRGDKGGFLTQATGWKPGILLPFIYLESLITRLLAPCLTRA